MAVVLPAVLACRTARPQSSQCAGPRKESPPIKKWTQESPGIVLDFSRWHHANSVLRSASYRGVRDVLPLLGGGGVDNLDRYARKFVDYMRTVKALCVLKLTQRSC